MTLQGFHRSPNSFPFQENPLCWGTLPVSWSTYLLFLVGSYLCLKLSDPLAGLNSKLATRNLPSSAYPFCATHLWRATHSLWRFSIQVLLRYFLIVEVFLALHFYQLRVLSGFAPLLFWSLLFSLKPLATRYLSLRSYLPKQLATPSWLSEWV